MSFEPRNHTFTSPPSFDAPFSVVLPRPRLLRQLVLTVALWRERTAQRRSLAQMDARSLRDAGISPAAAAYESGKSFWQPMGGLR
jgi:uncharacterized protein YjiS (DUF1127 family)